MNTLSNNGVTVSVTINGRPTRVYPFEGKYFIESRDGSEYAIEIKNSNWHRVEAVVAVDGLSVITGKPASKNDSGYVVNGNDTITIKGFRKSNEDVGAFKFMKKEKSYASGKGKGSNVGVIAIALYKEKTHFIYAQNTLTIGNNSGTWIPTLGTTGGYTTPTSSSDVYYCASSANDEKIGGILRGYKGQDVAKSRELKAQSVDIDFEHGTGWGKKIEDKVKTVEFEREFLMFTSELYYNSRERLEEMGIEIVPEKRVTLPKGFPNDYCEPPVGWTGK